MSDFTTTPLTADERAAFLGGVEWMRAAVLATISQDMDGRSFPAQLAMIDMTTYIEGITPPRLIPAAIGVCGEG